MPKVRFPIPDIKSYSPALDVRGAGNDVYVLGGRNYIFDSKGPKSGFATRLLAGGNVIGDPVGIAQSIEIADRCFVAVPSGIYELTDNESAWTLRLDLSSFDLIPFLPHKKWTAAYLSDGVYFCHPDYGFYKLTFTGFVHITDETVPGLPYKPIAVAETNGRLVILSQYYNVWSAPADAEDLTPTLGGAGFNLLSDRVTGQPVAMAAFQRGFLVWTEQDCLVAEFIGGDNVFRFDRATNQQIPLDANCVETLPDGSQIICTKQGLFIIKNGQEPERIAPIFSEFLREVLKHEPAIRIRLVYASEQDRLYVQLRDYTNHYVRTYVLAVALDKWGQFSDRHLGIIKYKPERGAYGYVDNEGIAHKFKEHDFNREVTPHVFTGLDSNITIGYIKPPNLTPEIDSLLEMHEILIGGEARPSWSEPVMVDLGEVPPLVCETESQTPIWLMSPGLTTAQMNDNYDSANGLITPTNYWENNTSTATAVNYDTGEVYAVINHVGDYTEPDYYTNTTFIQIVDSEGAAAQSFNPGVFTDGVTTHYTINDDTLHVDRHNGDLWGIWNQWVVDGATLARCVKANNYAFQATMMKTLYDVASPEAETADAGLGVDSNIVGFTANHIILFHEVSQSRDFKFEALTKDTLTRVSQAYAFPGTGNINGAGIEAGDVYGFHNFCIGPDDNLYFASHRQSTSPNGAFANGTFVSLHRFDPASGTYTDISPWSDSDLPVNDPDATVDNIRVRHIWYDRTTEKIQILFAFRTEALSTLTGTATKFHIGTFDQSNDTWTKNGALPSTGLLDINFESTAVVADQEYAVYAVEVLDVEKNMDSLPMGSPCQEYLRTIEFIYKAPDGVFDSVADYNDHTKAGVRICVRDPAQGFAIIEQFSDLTSRYDAITAEFAVGQLGATQFLKYSHVINEFIWQIDTNIQNYISYLPNRKYYHRIGNNSFYSDYWALKQHPYSRDWNIDWGDLYSFLEP